MLQNNSLKLIGLALAGVAQWIECQPVDQRVTGSILSQGTCLGCGPGPQMGTCERQLMGFSPSLTPFLLLFPKINFKKLTGLKHNQFYYIL